MTEPIIENEQEQLYFERLKILQETGRAILKAESTNSIAFSALRYLRKIIPCQRASAAEYDFANQQAFILATDTDTRSNLNTGLLVHLDSFGIAEDLRRGKIQHVEDLMKVILPTRVDRELFLEGIRSYINIPLIYQGALIGVLNLGSVDPNAFSSAHIEIARDVADLLAVAIQHARFHAKAESIQNITNTIRAANVSFMQGREANEILEKVLGFVKELVRFDSGRIYFRNEDDVFVQVVADQPIEPEKAEPMVFPAEMTLSEIQEHRLLKKVISARQSVLVADAPEELDLQIGRGDTAVRSWLGLPLQAAGRFIGVCSLERSELAKFNPQDQILADIIVFQAAVAIENARMYTEIQSHNLELTKRVEEGTQAEKRHRALAENLLEVMRALNSTLDLNEVLDKVLRNLSQVVPFDHGSLLLKQQNYFHVKNTLGKQHTNGNLQVIFPMDDPLLNSIIRKREPLILADTREENRFEGYGLMSDVRSWLGVPLIPHGREVIGFISLASQEHQVFSSEHASIAMTFAGQAAVAIENARLFGKVQKLAITDMLTGIRNRRYLYEIGQKELQRSIRMDHSLAVIMLDVDRFKDVNDTYGHATGDKVLVQLAQCCLDQLRNYDIFARYGGEEFVIILPETDIKSGHQVAERIRRAVEQMRVKTEKGEVEVTISLGVAQMNQEEISLEVLLDRADAALYEAKNAGRNAVCSYSGSDQESAEAG